MDNIISFFYVVFQANPGRGKVTYWVDGKTTKQITSTDTFLKLALSINSGKLYPKIFDATRTYSFYMWNTIDENLIHLVQKIEDEDTNKYKNSLGIEFKKAMYNKEYSSQDEQSQVQLSSEFQSLVSMGFELPTFDNVQNLIKQINEPKKEGDNFFRNLFKKETLKRS